MKKLFLVFCIFIATISWSQQKNTPSDKNIGYGKKVLLDYYFNNEYKKDVSGQMKRFHYTWEDESGSGFSLFGSIFRQYGATTDSLAEAPTATLLQNASVYIIVDPDTEKETVTPHYMQAAEAAIIYNWVNAGGVLLLMSNDSGNTEFTHFNQLPEKFGIHFNENCANHVNDNKYEMGALYMQAQSVVFKNARKVYIKEMSTLGLHPPAKADYKNKAGDILTAVARVGKGTVFAVGDPWFYNEYTDGKKLPPAYENYIAATDLVKWLLQRVPAQNARNN